MASLRAWRSYQTKSGRCAVHRHAPWLVLWLASGALGLPWLPCIWQCMHAFLLAPQPVPSIVQALALDGGVWELAACPCNHVCYSYSMPTLLVFVPRHWQRKARCGSWLPARALELTLNRFLCPLCQALALDGEMRELAAKLKGEQSLLVFGRGYNYATALEAALKVR